MTREWRVMAGLRSGHFPIQPDTREDGRVKPGHDGKVCLKKRT
jgi:hypothetical protein